jgi:hypothetical protein
LTFAPLSRQDDEIDNLLTLTNLEFDDVHSH